MKSVNKVFPEDFSLGLAQDFLSSPNVRANLFKRVLHTCVIIFLSCSVKGETGINVIYMTAAAAAAAHR